MEMIARTALIATDDPHDWDPGIDALEWRNKTQWRIIKLFYQSISPQHHQSLNLCMNYLFNDTIYLLTITQVFYVKIYSPNLYVLTCSLILWHWHSLSLSHLYTILLSLRDLKITAKNVSDFEVGRTAISGQRELTEGRRAPWELTAYTVLAVCTVLSVMHCTGTVHATAQMLHGGTLSSGFEDYSEIILSFLLGSIKHN